MTPAAIDAGSLLGETGDKMAEPIAAQKAGNTSLMAADAWSPPVRVREKMAAPSVSRPEGGEASPAAVDAGSSPI
jgi:hypothetical protein